MKSQLGVLEIANAFAGQLRSALGDKLNAVILYGSYARGDYEDGSDVDIMVLIDIPQEQLKEYWNAVTDIAFEVGWEHNLLISPILQSAEVFEKYKNASGFFKNVLEEGVWISA